MGHGHVGVLTVDLHLPEGASLKSKRKELLRVKSALARRHSCSVAEVDHHDLWQRARLTLALVSRSHGEAAERLEATSRALYADEVFQVLDLSREVLAMTPDGLGVR